MLTRSKLNLWEKNKWKQTFDPNKYGIFFSLLTQGHLKEIYNGFK